MKAARHSTNRSDAELLAKLIGVRESRLLYQGSLKLLFAPSSERGLM